MSKISVKWEFARAEVPAIGIGRCIRQIFWDQLLYRCQPVNYIDLAQLIERINRSQGWQIFFEQNVSVRRKCRGHCGWRAFVF